MQFKVVDFPALEIPIKGIYMFFPFFIYFSSFLKFEFNIDIFEFLLFSSSLIYNFNLLKILFNSSIFISKSLFFLHLFSFKSPVGVAF